MSKTMNNRSYKITPRAPDLGGGWRLALLEDDEEMGGGIFPVETVDAFLLAAAYDDALEEGEAWTGNT